MHHLKRLLWLAAWGVWVWLGVGLHRELPRDLGPAVHSIPSQHPNFIWGFVDRKPKIAVMEFRSDRDEYVWRIHDAYSGENVSEFCVPRKPLGPIKHSPNRRFLHVDHPPTDFSSVLKIDATIPEALPKWPVQKLHLLDLAAARWLEITIEEHRLIYHPTKPWAVFWTGGGRDYGNSYVVVHDMETGRRIFEWRERIQSKSELSTTPLFIGDDRIGIPTVRSRSADGSLRAHDLVLEVWAIGPSNAAPSLHPDSGVGAHYGSEGAVHSSTSRGRVAWNRSRRDGLGVAVFDLPSGSTVLQEPPVEQGWMSSKARLSEWTPPPITEDGRKVLNIFTGRLLEVDTGKAIWTSGSSEFLTSIGANECFEVQETWLSGFELFMKPLVTFAVRDMHTGAVRYRSWNQTLQSECTVGDGHRLVLVGADVHELPLLVNWPLLALCQTILALPLVMLWAGLKWRRRRAARREPVVLRESQ